MKLKDVATVKTDFEDADFWIVRRGSIDTVGNATNTFNPEHIGVKVTATDVLDPNYLFYFMTFLHTRGVWKQVATGSLRLVNIKTSDVANIPLTFSSSR